MLNELPMVELTDMFVVLPTLKQCIPSDSYTSSGVAFVKVVPNDHVGAVIYVDICREYT